MWMILWISPTSHLLVPFSSNVAAHILPIRSKSGLKGRTDPDWISITYTKGIFPLSYRLSLHNSDRENLPWGQQHNSRRAGRSFGFISNKHRSLPHSASHQFYNRGRPTRFACGKRPVPDRSNTAFMTLITPALRALSPSLPYRFFSLPFPSLHWEVGSWKEPGKQTICTNSIANLSTFTNKTKKSLVQ